MATKVVVCPGCESPVDAGRFSCSSCGAVVAAVASVPRSFVPAEPVMPPILEAAVPETIEADAAPEASPPADEPETVDEVRWPEPDPVPAASAPAAPLMPPATSWKDRPLWSNQPSPSDEPAPSNQPAPSAEPARPEEPAWPEAPAWPPTRDAPVALEPPVRTPAGSYLPPSAVLPPGEALPVNGKNGSGHATAAAAPAQSKAPLVGRFALGEGDGPLGLAPNAPGRTIALGAAIAGLGLMLPWAEIVIGSGAIGGFLNQWGLAGPGHPIVLLLLIGVGALAVAHERWPIHVSAGIAAIVLGSVLLGLAFPYVMGPFREAVGVYVTAAGGIIMIAGGLLARAAQRHEPEDASV